MLFYFILAELPQISFSIYIDAQKKSNVWWRVNYSKTVSFKRNNVLHKNIITTWIILKNLQQQHLVECIVSYLNIQMCTGT